MRRLAHWPALCALGTLTSCDPVVTSEMDLDVRRIPSSPLPPPPPPPPLAILTGTIRLPPGVATPTGDLLAALVWYPDQLRAPNNWPEACENAGARVETGFVAQQVRLEPRFPSHFTLNVTELPPAEALVPFDDGQPASWTTGQLLIYQDGNGNGQLDRSRPFETPADRVLGASSPDRTGFGPRQNGVSYVIYYSSARRYVPRIEPGFTLFRDQMDSSTRTAVPLDTVMDIELSNDVRTQVQGCESLCMSRDDFECPETPLELPNTGDGRCNPRTENFWASYYWTEFICHDCACVVHGGCHYALDPSLPVPPAWPCKP